MCRKMMKRNCSYVQTHCVTPSVCLSVCLQLVRPGMQVPTRLPRAPLSAPIPPLNAAAGAAVVGQTAVQQVLASPSSFCRLTSDPSPQTLRVALVHQGFLQPLYSCMLGVWPIHLIGSSSPGPTLSSNHRCSSSNSTR